MPSILSIKCGSLLRNSPAESRDVLLAYNDSHPSYLLALAYNVPTHFAAISTATSSA
jgi:hypothetical protein